jgi:hypothetical protein
MKESCSFFFKKGACKEMKGEGEGERKGERKEAK